MADVLITPASGIIEFKDGSNNVDGQIELLGTGNLQFTSPGGRLLFDDSQFTSSLYDINSSAGTSGQVLISTGVGISWSSSGSGSGLDADTLDGLDSTQFLRSDVDDSFTGTITGTSNAVDPVLIIDGSGPNIIRFLDQGSTTAALDLVYRTTPNTLGFEKSSNGDIFFTVDADAPSGCILLRGGDNNPDPVEVQRGNPTVDQVSMQFSATNSRWFGKGTDNNPYWSSTNNISAGDKIWHAGNDGSGSGLDADTLDGINSASFLRSDVADTKAGTTLFTDVVTVDVANNQILLHYGATSHPTVIHRNDSANYYILLSAAGTSPSGAWNTLRPFIIDLTSGLFTSNNGQSFSGGTVIGGSLELNSTLLDINNQAGTAGQVLSSTGTGVDWIDTSTLSVGDADTLDGLDSTQFLRSDVADTHSGGVLTFSTGINITSGPGTIAGTTFDNGWLRIGNSTLGWTFDNNEFYVAGAGVIGTLSGATLTFNAIPAFNGGTSGSTSPFTVDSNTVVTNLNADLLDGINGASFLRSDAADTASGDINFTSTSNPITTNAIRFNNTENSGTYYTDGTGVLAFDENFYNDTNYGTGTYDPQTVFTGGNGGGILIKNEDGWGAVFTTQNTRWASAEWGNLKIGSNQVWHAGNDGSGSGLDADTLDGIDSSDFFRGNDFNNTGNIRINNTSPTIGLIDTDHATATIHVNSNLFYILRNSAGNAGWATVDGVWPFVVNLLNNDITVGRTLYSNSYQNQYHFYSLWREDGVTALSNSYNFIMGATNDTGNKMVMFLNSSTRTTDGGANGLTFRNDGGPLTLGTTAQTTNFYAGNSSRILIEKNTPAISNGSYDVGNASIELRTTDLSNPILGFHRSGSTATALYHSGHGVNSLRIRNADGNDGPIWWSGNDGSGSGLDADTLDGIDSLSFLRSNIIDTWSVTSTASDSTIYGVTFDHNLTGTTALTANRTKTGIYVDVDHTSTVGTTVSGQRETIYGTWTDVLTSGTPYDVYGLYGHSRSTNTTGTIVTLVGVRGYAEGDSGVGGTTTSVYGIQGDARDGGAGTVSSVYGGQFFVLKETAATATLATAIGTRSEVEIDGNTITNTYAAQHIIDIDGGTLTNAYLTYGAYEGTPQANNWSAYYPSAAPSYFANEVRIGSTTDLGSYALQVTGSAIVTSALELNGTLVDINNQAGTAGQILSSTGTGVDWIDTSSIAVGNADLLDNIDSSRFVYGDNATKTTYTGDFNAFLSSGFYNHDNATGAPAATWYHLIANRHTNTANNYQMQIAGEFFNSSNLYYRIIDNNTPSAWQRIWHSGNDGSGSGLDADTLDGENLVDSAATASTVVGRNGSGDIFARLIRQTYADQATISGGMVYRVNNSTDNYLRVCNDTAAIRTYLNVPTRTGGDASGTWGINITGSSASTTGNAATATTLQTARTIWGQSFNGSANISGNLTSVGNITGTGAITITAGGTNTSITLTPNGTGTVNAPTFNATSTTSGGFQGIDADSAGSPSFTWSGDLNTGMYRSGTDSIGFSAAGALVTSISTTNMFHRQDLYISNNADSAATSGTTTIDSERLYFRGKYWNGSSSQNGEWSIFNDMDGTGPNSNLTFTWQNLIKLTIDENGVISAPGSGYFSGSLSGNATTATYLSTITTLWGQSFNGSANVSGDLTSVGNITGTGTATFATFSGSGASLTSLNASNLSSGTVPDARISGAYNGFTTINGFNIGGSSGNWYTNIATVASNGVLEIGRYIDFHSSSTTTSDYDGRLEVSGTNNFYFSGILRINTLSPNVTGGRRIISDGPLGIETSNNGLFLDTNGGNLNLQAGAGYLISDSTYNKTTTAAANMRINASGQFLTSTSSLRYKTNIEDVNISYSENIVYNSRPVWFRSTSIVDNPDWSWWGFIAEELDLIDKRLVDYDSDGNPNGVQYDRFTIHLVKVAQEQKKTIDNLNTILEEQSDLISDLQSRLTSLEQIINNSN